MRLRCLYILLNKLKKKTFKTTKNSFWEMKIWLTRRAEALYYNNKLRSRCSLLMILLQLSLDFATIHVCHIISFIFKNGWYITRLKVSFLRCVSHNRLQNSWHESDHYKQRCLLNKNFQLYILFQCYGAIFLLGLSIFLGQKMKIRNILSSCLKLFPLLLLLQP